MRRSGNWSLVIIGVFVLVAMSLNCAAETYYVSTTGNDDNPGTEAQPWASLLRASASAAGGDVVIVQEGTYNLPQQDLWNGGEEGNPVVYQAQGSVIINGPANPAVIGFAGDYMVLDGFEIFGGFSTERFLNYFGYVGQVQAYQSSIPVKTISTSRPWRLL